MDTWSLVTLQEKDMTTFDLGLVGMEVVLCVFQILGWCCGVTIEMCLPGAWLL